MILRDPLLRRNVAEHSTLLLVVASHIYKDDAWLFLVTPESAFFRNLLGLREHILKACNEYDSPGRRDVACRGRACGPGRGR